MSLVALFPSGTTLSGAWIAIAIIVIMIALFAVYLVALWKALKELFH